MTRMQTWSIDRRNKKTDDTEHGDIEMSYQSRGQLRSQDNKRHGRNIQADSLKYKKDEQPRLNSAKARPIDFIPIEVRD